MPVFEGFRKVNQDRWEFANEGFLKGQKHLLRNISRRKPVHGQSQHQQQQLHSQSVSVGACVEVGKFGLEEEVERLKRDKNVLMQELVKLRQQQQTTDNQMQTMAQRLQGMEQRQQQMMSFLAKAVNSPGFLSQFVQQQNDRMMEGNKKRRIRQDFPSDDLSVTPADGQIVKYQPVMNEAAKAMLRQMMKVDSSPRLDNFGSSPENLLIGDGSTQSSGLDCLSSNRVSGVTLQEVPPVSAEIADIQLSDISSLVGGQNLPPVSLSQSPSANVPDTNVNINALETETGSFMDAGTLGVNGKLPLDIDTFSPEPQIDWQNAFMDDLGELPSVGDPFWEKFLQSPAPAETEEMDSAAIEDIQTETKQLENGWDKAQHLQHLTEQMGLLTSNGKKV